MPAERGSATNQPNILPARLGRDGIDDLLVGSLVACHESGRGDGLGFAEPVAGVLHQQHFGRQDEGSVLRFAIVEVLDDVGDAAGVDVERLAQIEGRAREQAVGKWDAGDPADTRTLRVEFRHLGREAAELAAQRGLVGLHQFQNLFASLR